jgi:F-box/leucine-rich repeat protein 2/20
MEGPSFLPEDLVHYKQCSTDHALFQALIQKPDELVHFFQVACEDENWAQDHVKLIRLILRWAAKSYYLNQLPLIQAKQIVQCIQQHVFLHPLLYFKSALFFTILLKVGEHEILVNSFMWGICSPVLAEIFKFNCFQYLKNEWVLQSIPLSLFRLVEEHVLRGKIESLWKHSEKEIMALMDLAKKWEIFLLEKECAEVLHRYLQQDNVVDLLINAHRQFFKEWKANCSEFFNQHNQEIQVLEGRETDLRVQFLKFTEEASSIFKRLAPWVTHLGFRDYSKENKSLLIDFIHSCPKLKGINLKGGNSEEALDILSDHILELNISECSWVNAVDLRKISQQCPHLKELDLEGNVHLTYQAWCELDHFRQLQVLHLKWCHQITNEDLKLICHSCPALVELDLEGCRRIEDVGITNMISICPQLAVLNLSYCDQLTNRSLMEIVLRAYELTHLNISHCSAFSNQVILKLIELRPNIKLNS